jgi:inorganic pyrophosphatase
MTLYYLNDDQGNDLSFWNDIPLGLHSNFVTCCIEIPKEKSAKYQVYKSAEHHPFMQDTKKNIFTGKRELRFYAQFPLFNYGFIPQTWEQNLTKDSLGLYVKFH